MAKLNRGSLLKLAKAGKVLAVGSRSFCDMHGESGGSIPEKPVKVLSNFGETNDKDFFCIPESDFKSKSGCVFEGKDGHVCLIVHSNCSYDLKIVA